jgi:pilus assembly protein Flp/PilA
MFASFLRVSDADEGQALAEYALILALIAVVAIAVLVILGTNIQNILSTIGASV